MSKLAKVLVTAVIVFVFIAVFAVIVGVRSDAWSSGPGIFGLIAFAGMIGGIRAVWKSSDKHDDENDSSVLQK